MWTGPDCSSNLYSKPDLSSFNAKHGFFNGWKADLFLLTPFFFLLRSDPGENKSGNWATLVSENEMNQTSRMNKLLIMLKWLTWVDLHFLGQIDIQRFNEFFGISFIPHSLSNHAVIDFDRRARESSTLDSALAQSCPARPLSSLFA